ncbi:MAG: hypothetical protein OJI67_17430 [Prosthecobacter sp.]|nr:hypothetical protein [Prosthecobacter sp.]
MSDELPKHPKGKVGRLPAKIREEVCRRILDGQSAPQILPWLNGLEETKKAMAVHFDGQEITPQNLSAWRTGGFQVWKAQQDDIQETRERALYSMRLAKASGGNLSEGALAQVTGEVMELMEQITALRRAGADIDLKALMAINKILVNARARELETQSHQLDLKKLDQKDRELALAERVFQTKTAEMFLKFFEEEETRRIATSGERKETKVKELVQHWFGEMPDNIGPPSLRK